MIKKINILIVLTAVLGTLYFVFTKDNNIVLVLKDISIVFTISALYIINKIFKLNISDGLNFVYIVFVFIAHFLGVICELYNHIYWFDKFSHFLSGILSSFVAIYILVKTKDKNNLFIKVLFIICFSISIATLWEVFEYLASVYLNVDPQKVKLTGVTDTMNDIIVAILGTIIVSVCYWFEHKENKKLLIKSFEEMV